MHCLVFTDTDLYSLTKGKAYLANQRWRRSTCLRDQCYDVGCHPWILVVENIIPRNVIINRGAAEVDNHISRDDIFDCHPLRKCYIYFIIPNRTFDPFFLPFVFP